MANTLTLKNDDEVPKQFIFETPFTMVLAGPTSCGKTTFIKNMILTAHERFADPPSRFLYFYNRYQPIFAQLQEMDINIDFVHGMPTLSQIEDELVEDEDLTLIFDDIANYMSKETVEIFTVLSHHARVIKPNERSQQFVHTNMFNFNLALSIFS